ncbi:hypothetical protein D3C73_1044690 [compost metagenome]
MNTTAHAGNFRTGDIHDSLLRVVHHGHSRRYTLADHRTGGQRTVGIEGFDPVVILDPQLFGVSFTDPDNRPAARQRQHQQVFAVRGVDAPFLVRRQEVQRFFREAVRWNLTHFRHATGIDWWSISHQAFAKGTHPRVILIQLLATGQGAPWDQFVYVGIAGVVGDMLAFKTRPGWAGDDLARLCLNIAKTNLLVFFVQSQMRVITPGHRPQGLPGFHRHLTVGFRCQREDHFRGVQRGVDQRSAFRRAFTLGVVQLTEEIDFSLGVPRDAFPAVTQFIH